LTVEPPWKGDLAPRLTPYEVAFGSAGYGERVFPRIERETRENGIDPAQRDRFGFLATADEAVEEAMPAAATPEMVEQYRALLFHGFNFWRRECPLYLLEAAVARYLVEAAPALEGWELALPERALYLQLPPNLFWASITPDEQPEPVDGFFVAAAPGEDPLGPPFRELEVLLVLGLRQDRAGFSVIPVSTEAGPGIAQVWIDEPGREGESDFENVLPGGEMAGLYSILTTTEALKLVARTLWYVDVHPQDVVAAEPPAERSAARPGLAPPSALPYRRVTLAREGGSGA
jgi:hypothetical protein